LKRFEPLFFLPSSLVGKSFIIFIILICISPTIQLLLTHGNSPASIFDFIIILIPDLSLLSVWIAFFIEKRRANTRLYLPDYALLSFILINVIWGFILSDNMMTAFKGFRITYLPISLYFLARFWQPDRETISKTLQAIFFILIILAFSGWILWLFFPEFTKLMYEYSGHPIAIYFVVRMTSFLWTPVLFGTLMAWAGFYYFWKTLRNPKFFNIDLILLIIAFSGLTMSVSRGPMLSFLLAIIALIPFFEKLKKALMITGLLIVIQSVISLIVMNDLQLQRWTVSSTVSTMSMNKDITRVSRWDSSMNDFRLKPMGHGLGNAGEVAYKNLDPKNKATLSTDGWYLKLACETGIPGLLSFLALAVIFLILLWRNRAYSIELLGFPLLGFASMIIVQCISSNVLDFHPYIGIFWFITGLSIKNKQETET